MDNKSIITILRILIFIAGILFITLFNTIPQNDCQACSVGEERLNGYDMYEYYEEECINYKKLEIESLQWPQK